MPTGDWNCNNYFSSQKSDGTPDKCPKQMRGGVWYKKCRPQLRADGTKHPKKCEQDYSR